MTEPVFVYESSAHELPDRYDAWRTAFGPAFATNLPGLTRPDEFDFSVRGWQLGSSIMIRASCGDHTELRGPREIHGLPVDHYCVVIPFMGEVRCDVGKSRHRALPGQALIIDLARQWSNEFAGSGAVNRFVSLWIPRRALNALLRHSGEPHGVVCTGALASLLVSHVRSLAGAGMSMDPDQASPVMQATIQLLAANLCQSKDVLRAARPALESVLLREACRHIDQRLGESGLTPQSVATAFGLSRASLYRLFEPLGGVAAYVRERRLQRMRDIIQFSSKEPNLARLAETFCFSSASHFTRAFRGCYGYAPSEARNRFALESSALSVELAGGAGESGFAHSLQSLRA